MSGLPGAGKSKLARELQKVLSKTKDDCLIVSADFFFMKEGIYVYDRARLGAAHASCFADYLHALQERTPVVIVDNTNLKPTDIAPYMLAAAALGYQSAIVEVRCDPEMAAARNLHGAELAAVKGMFKLFCERQLESYWRVVPWEIV
jgi:tRNA uridine 5-carbamoylmethylation protein Kti12